MPDSSSFMSAVESTWAKFEKGVSGFAKGFTKEARKSLHLSKRHST